MTTQGKPIAEYFRKYYPPIIIALIILSGITLRLTTYYNRTSIGNNDTPKFISCSEIPFFSEEFFTSNRPPTVTLLYKLVKPASGYHLTNVSEPGLPGGGSELDRTLQPGLDHVAMTQTALSIFCWSILAWIISRRIHHLFIRIAAIILLLLFAFSPQLADWDGVLLSEPVSFAFFAVVFGFSIEASFRLSDIPNQIKKPSFFLIITAWLISITLWVFSRDSNAYFLLVSIIFIGLLLLLNLKQKSIVVLFNIIIICSFVVLFLTHNTTLRKSDRWINPLFNNLMVNVFPFPERVAYFQNQGMPVTPELLSYAGKCCGQTGFYAIPPFVEWITKSGYSSYTNFLITHPYWSLTTFFSKLDFFFSENRQPFFFGTPDTTPMWLIPIGNILHPQSSLVILADFLLVLTCITIAYRTCNKEMMIWGWFFCWMLSGFFALLFVSYHGDAAGIIRHALVGVMPLRLLLWILLIIIADNLMKKQSLC